MKQTAVEWLFEEMKNNIILIADKEGYNIMMSVDGIEKIFNQAKTMEKKQIIEAWKNGDNEFDEVANTFSEKYYNETFKSE